MEKAFVLNPIIAEHEKINETNSDAPLADELIDKNHKIDIPENVSHIQSSEPSESPKDESGSEDSKPKTYKNYFLYVEDDDVQIDAFLPVLNGEPAKGKFYVFKRRKDAQQIINHLTRNGKQAVILGESIRSSSKTK